MNTIKRLINLITILLQCHMIFANPGIVDSPEIRKNREKANMISSKLNSIVPAESNNGDKQSPGTISTSITSMSNFQPMKMTYEDVIRGANSVYGSQFTNGGVIFAISGQSSSTPLMTAAPQPVLLQYLSPEGITKQSAVQYIQLLRPLMMVPAQNYLPAPSSISTVNIQTETTTKSSLNPYGPYIKSSNSLVGAHSAPLTSYIQSNPRPLMTPSNSNSHSTIGLNMNEYVPAASSRIATSVISPQVQSMTAFKPSKYPMLAQRA